MDKISLNLVCSSIALLGGDKKLIDTVRSLNEETNFENLSKMMKCVEKLTLPYIDKGLNYKMKGAMKEMMKGNLTIDDREDSLTVVTEDKYEKIITYHKSSEH